MSFEVSDNLPKYYRTISKLQPLTVAEEHALVVLIKKGDESAIHKLVKHNLKIVITISNRHIGQGLAIDDLIQEGNIGMYEAAKVYEPNGDARFINYASLWVRKRINEAIAKYGRVVRLPHNKEYEIYKAKQAGIETPNLEPIHLDDNITEDSENTYGDIILGVSPDFEEAIEIESRNLKISKALASLKERDRKIIKSYFGIDREYARLAEDIAAEFHMSNVRVCQIVKASLLKMKEVI